MKRKIAISIVLALSLVWVLLISSDSSVNAQRNRLYRYDSGVITLGANQILRITANGQSAGDAFNVQLTRQFAGQPLCSGGVCRSSFFNIEALPVMNVPADESVSMDSTLPPNTSGVRVLATVNDPKAVINLHIIDPTTGNTVSLVSSSDFDTL